MIKSDNKVYVVGAGLAGSECAFQLAELGHHVCLIEMRDKVKTAAHKTTDFAELVCSNSFGSMTNYSAPGQLKWEMAHLNSIILESALAAQLPAGMALGVDREVFSQKVTNTLRNHPRIEIVNACINSIDEIPRPAVIATGPLTHDNLAMSLQQHFESEFLYFFDAIAPIVETDSINMDIAWKGDRWGKGNNDYINCPLSKEQYFKLIEEIKAARKVEAKDFEKDTPYFEGCMPIEEIVSRGDLTLKHGPLSPKGLMNPRTQNKEYAVVQLRQDNKAGTAFNMVGFQTKMAYPEQKRVFSLIPGLENAEFLKLGSIHRNLYVHSPKVLTKNLCSKKDSQLFFAGQVSGVEGYFESTCIGLLVANFIDDFLKDRPINFPPLETALGSLLNGITEEKDIFQPTNINFGLMPPIDPKKYGVKKIPKRDKRDMQVKNAQESFLDWTKTLEEKKIYSTVTDLAKLRG